MNWKCSIASWRNNDQKRKTGSRPVAICAVFLAAALLTGCGANRPTFNIALANVPTPSKALRRKVEAPHCATPGKQDLTVPQLENERDCYMSAEIKVRTRHNQLVDSTNQTVRAVQRLSGKKKKPARLASWLPASIRAQRSFSH